MMHCAAHDGHTAAELFAQRAYARGHDMGLIIFSGAKRRRSDVAIAKN